MTDGDSGGLRPVISLNTRALVCDSASSDQIASQLFFQDGGQKSTSGDVSHLGSPKKLFIKQSSFKK